MQEVAEFLGVDPRHIRYDGLCGLAARPAWGRPPIKLQIHHAEEKGRYDFFLRTISC